MIERPYRCQNEPCSEDVYKRLIFDFWSTEPVCPKCGSDGRDPVFGKVIIALNTIHFDPPTKVRGIGKRHRACDPSKPTVAVNEHSTHGGSGHPDAVNCRECRESEAYRLAVQGIEEEE
jgi:hypothetical protein